MLNWIKSLILTKMHWHLKALKLKSWIAHLKRAVSEGKFPSQSSEELPPPHKIFIGGGDFKAVGEEFLKHFKNLCDLRPDERILDVGCGIGRIAIPLTKYLNESGSYEGIDVVQEGIDWCNTNIKTKYPNFNFQVMDVYNKVYNPKGSTTAKEHRFRFEDESFDFIFLTSVVTHMLPEDMENYIRETARTLKTGGRCLITFFLWNEESAKLIAEGRSRYDFKYKFERYRAQYASAPEAAICYDEPFILGLFEKYGLKINPPIQYGNWCGRLNSLSHQDMVIAAREILKPCP